MNRLVIAFAFLLLGISSEAQQVCFGSSCSSSSSSEITPTTPTSGFTANTLIRTDGTNFLSGPKFLSGNLSLEVGLNYCPDSGANDTYVCTLSGGSLSAYSAGTFIVLKANTANTGTATVAVDGLSAITITRRDDSALQTGDISAGDYVPLVYDGNTFRMQRGFQSGVTFDGSTLAVTGAATISGATTIGGAGITGTTVPLTISRGSSSGNIANFQTTSGTTVSSVDNLGNFIAPVGTISAPGLAFLGETGTGFYRPNANKPCLATGGATAWCIDGTTIGYAFSVKSSAAIGFSGSLPESTGIDTYFTREGAAIMQLGADANGSPVNQTFKAHDGITGTNIAGAALTVAGGRGTGDGAGGNRIDQTSRELSTGTTAQTLQDRTVIVAKAKALTAGAATNVVLINVASGAFGGGSLEYTVQASDGTDHQARSGRIQWAVVNKAGTETCTVSGASEAADSSTLAESAGGSTLTYAITADTTATNGCYIAFNAVSSLTETVLNIAYRITGNGGTSTFTAQ